MLYVGERLRGSNGTCSTLCQVSVTPSATHSQIGPLRCWFPSGWAWACSRPLWVPPRNSPVRLGVSPTATSTPTGIFNQRFEALFPCAGALGCAVRFASQFLPVYLHMNAGPPLCQLLPLQVRQLPPLPLLPAWMNVSSLTPWLWDFHAVRFSVSSGCFLFLNLLLSFFWLCEEAQCVYLRLHLGRQSYIHLFINQYLFHFRKWMIFMMSLICQILYEGKPSIYYSGEETVTYPQCKLIEAYLRCTICHDWIKLLI